MKRWNQSMNLLITVLLFRSILSNKKFFRELSKLIQNQESLMKGTLYPLTIKKEDFNKDSLTCSFYSKEKDAYFYTKCPLGSSCFVYTAHTLNGNRDSQVLKLGCWRKEFPKHDIKCTQSRCKIMDDYTKITLESQKMYFCCCKDSICNDIRSQNDNDSDKAVVVKRNNIKKKNPFANSVFIVIVIISGLLFIAVIIFFLVTYSCKQKKQQLKNTTVSKLYPINSIPKENLYHQKISYEALTDILHGNLIHQGYGSAIRLGTYEKKTVAIKIYPPRSYKEYLNEKKIISLLGDHCSIAKYLVTDIIYRGPCFEGILVMNYYRNGSLLNYLRQHVLSSKDLLILSYSIVNGLAHMHKESCQNDTRGAIAHRDLTSRNILVKNNGTCVLADFGFAVELNGEKPITSMIGEMRYAAPELLFSAETTYWQEALKQIDIYALGMVLWEICRRCTNFYEKEDDMPSAKLPFAEEFGNRVSYQKFIASFRHYICIEKIRPVIPGKKDASDLITSSFRKIIEECWSDESESRLTSLCVLHRLESIYTELFPNDIPLENLKDIYSSNEEDPLPNHEEINIEDSNSHDDDYLLADRDEV